MSRPRLFSITLFVTDLLSTVLPLIPHLFPAVVLFVFLDPRLLIGYFFQIIFTNFPPNEKD
jgi:hypothetical protein